MRRQAREQFQNAPRMSACAVTFLPPPREAGAIFPLRSNEP